MAHVDTDETPKFEIGQAPAAFKSVVWKHFGFTMAINAKEERVVDRQWTMR